MQYKLIAILKHIGIPWSKDTLNNLISALQQLMKDCTVYYRLIKVFFGDTKKILGELIQFWETRCLTTDVPFQTNILGLKLAIIHKPEDLQTVLNKNCTLTKSILYQFFEHTFGKGMITAKVSDWKPQRRILTPAFQPQALEGLMHIFNESNKLLIRDLEPFSDTGKHVDLWELLVSTNISISNDTVIGTDYKMEDEEKKKFQNVTLKAMEIDFLRLSKLWMYPQVIFNLYTKLKGYTNIFDKVQHLPNKVIAHKRKLREVGTNEKNEARSFLDRIMDANEEQKIFSDKLLRDQIITLIFAGSETTALTVGFTLLMLAMNPDIQEKVHNEIMKLVGQEENIEKRHLDDLSYLEQCINETLRLFPPVPIFGRHTKEKILLKNVTLAAHTQIAISPLGIQRSTLYYSNPLEWNPDNFLPEEIKKRSTYSFIPFSRGPRMCIGARYAMMSIKISLSLLLRKFKVTTDFKFHQIELSMDSILRSVHGFPVKLHSRKKN